MGTKEPKDKTETPEVEPNVTLAEFESTGGVNVVLVAGLRAQCMARNEPLSRPRSAWVKALDEFANAPA